jgi:small subunit ribosomal protein S1
MSWDRIDHPNQLLKVGEEVKVKVISVDRDRRRVGLSLRALQADPWNEQVKELKIGQLGKAKLPA